MNENDSYYDHLWSEYDEIYLIQLLPIEMLHLCNQASVCDPVVILLNVHWDFFKWNWNYLSWNCNITMEFVLKHTKLQNESKNRSHEPNQVQWNWYVLTRNSQLLVF